MSVIQFPRQPGSTGFGSSKPVARIALFSLAALGLASLALPASTQSLLQKAERDEIALVQDSDPGMAFAMKKARATLPGFLAVAKANKPPTEGFSVKVAVREGANAEYFWITPFEQTDKGFTGKLNNTPRMVKGVKMGQTMNFAESEIVDWMYFDAGKMKGNYTACALLKRETKQQQDAFLKRFGLDCSAS